MVVCAGFIVAPRPNFFIVGAPKSGTTALFGYLEQHPDVFVPIDKEPHYFAPDLLGHPLRDRSTHLTLQEYLALFAAAGDARWVGEASTLYLRSTQAASRIHEFAPHAKIVASLRNPVEMVYALYHQQMYGALSTHVADDDVGILLPYEQVGEYATQLERYFAAFGQRNVHVIVFDDLRRDTARVYRELLDFFELGPWPVDLSTVNESKQVRIPWLKRLMDRPPAWASRMVRSLPRRPYRRLITSLEAVHSRVARRPDMPRAWREHLRQRFVEETRRLGAMLGRDLSHWTD